MPKAKQPQWPADTVERWPIGKLLAYPQNPMVHTDAQIERIAASIKEHGWTMPALVDEAGVLICGHARVRAAQTLGITEIPTMVARGWTEAQKKSYRIADNQLPRLAEFDADMLRLELTDLKLEGYDLSLTGFDDVQLVQFMAGVPSGADPEAVPEPPATPMTKRRDIWILGQHRIMCGDATDEEDVAALLDGEIPDLANCDPPYGISIVKRATDGGPKPFGKVGGGKPHPFAGQGRVHAPGPDGFKGRVYGPARRAIIQPGVYAPVIGDDSTDTAVAAHHVLKELGIEAIVLWGGNYYANHLPASRCWLVWDKENTGSFADVELAWTNQDAIARIFRHQWSGLIKASERGEKRVHPTQKPVALAEWVIETVSPQAKTTLDLFLGSASSLIAAERKGVRHYGMELAESYIDAAIIRWQDFSGKQAHHASTGLTYEEERDARTKPAPKRKRAPRAIAAE